jgi:signal transduction histidine kinase
LSNSIAYTPKKGGIKISASDTDKFISVMVEDTGIGIPKKDLPHIFERFYRTDKSRSRKTGGTGVGLAIVKGLMEAHGGEVFAESEEGKGSKFTCRFAKM